MEHGVSGGGREKHQRGRRQRRRHFRVRGGSAGAPGEGLCWGGAQTTISRAALGEGGSATTPGEGGSVRVYRVSDSESEWTQLGVDIDGEQIDEYSGFSVSLSGDGNTVAIGSPNYYDSYDEYYVGQVKVYIVE